MAIASAYGQELSILIVDDHTLTRTMVRSILKGTGYENVMQAESGRAAIEVILSTPVDLVVCDWNMPDGNGIEVLRTLRGDARFASLPFLMLTAEAYRENVSAAMEAGVSDYIIKPFTSDILLEKLEIIVKSIVAKKSRSRATNA